MKALVVCDDAEVITLLDAALSRYGFDTILYRWLLKALDNMEEISPDFTIISVSDYPRHWKTLSQFINSGIGRVANKIILYTPEPLSSEESAKADTLEIVGCFSSLDESRDGLEKLRALLGITENGDSCTTFDSDLEQGEENSINEKAPSPYLDEKTQANDTALSVIDTSVPQTEETTSTNIENEDFAADTDTLAARDGETALAEATAASHALEETQENDAAPDSVDTNTAEMEKDVSVAFVKDDVSVAESAAETAEKDESEKAFPIDTNPEPLGTGTMRNETNLTLQNENTLIENEIVPPVVDGFSENNESEKSLDELTEQIQETDSSNLVREAISAPDKNISIDNEIALTSADETSQNAEEENIDSTEVNIISPPADDLAASSNKDIPAEDKIILTTSEEAKDNDIEVDINSVQASCASIENEDLSAPLNDDIAVDDEVCSKESTETASVDRVALSAGNSEMMIEKKPFQKRSVVKSTAMAVRGSLFPRANYSLPVPTNFFAELKTNALSLNSLQQSESGIASENSTKTEKKIASDYKIPDINSITVSEKNSEVPSPDFKIPCVGTILEQTAAESPLNENKETVPLPAYKLPTAASILPDITKERTIPKIDELSAGLLAHIALKEKTSESSVQDCKIPSISSIVLPETVDSNAAHNFKIPNVESICSKDFAESTLNVDTRIPSVDSAAKEEENSKQTGVLKKSLLQRIEEMYEK